MPHHDQAPFVQPIRPTQINPSAGRVRFPHSCRAVRASNSRVSLHQSSRDRSLLRIRARICLRCTVKPARKRRRVGGHRDARRCGDIRGVPAQRFMGPAPAALLVALGEEPSPPVHAERPRTAGASLLPYCISRPGARLPRDRGVQAGDGQAAGMDRAALRGGEAVAQDATVPVTGIAEGEH